MIAGSFPFFLFKLLCYAERSEKASSETSGKSRNPLLKNRGMKVFCGFISYSNFYLAGHYENK